ncbi:hypothetical protein D9M70_541880 [compost metagenome]
MLGLVMAQEARGVAMQQRAGGDHLGVEQRVLRQQAQEEPAVTVGPVHHRRDGEAAGQGGCGVLRHIESARRGESTGFLAGREGAQFTSIQKASR